MDWRLVYQKAFIMLEKRHSNPHGVLSCMEELSDTRLLRVLRPSVIQEMVQELRLAGRA